MEVDAKHAPFRHFMLFRLGWPSYAPVTKTWPSVKSIQVTSGFPLKSVCGYKLQDGECSITFPAQSCHSYRNIS
jgi:hypothetical protein